MNNHFRSENRGAGRNQNNSREWFQRRDQRQNTQGEINPRQVILDVLTSFDAHHNDPERLIDTALR